MNDLEFWSSDKLFGLRLSSKHFSYILKECARAAPNETGGIFIGYYTDNLDCAYVTAVSKAPIDSRSGKDWFNRGKQGLGRWLNKLWQKRHHYLGEWHFHPDGKAIPSRIDMIQMRRIANSADYNCTAPLLLIIGGDLLTEWEAKVYVFPPKKPHIELLDSSSNSVWQ